MEIIWRNETASFDRLVLAGDIGGTNTNLALVGESSGKFTILLETVCASRDLTGLADPIRETLAIAVARRADLIPTRACISAAGPVSDNHCTMTNLAWNIDGPALAVEFGFPVRVINDFLAIAYGVPTLDVNDPQQIAVIAHSDGSRPVAQAATKAVIGPGTGLGVAFLVWDGVKYVPASSEGGHMVFAPWNEETQSFRDYMFKRYGKAPGVEPFVSGTGIGNLYEWWRDTRGVPSTEPWQAIEAADSHARPRMISDLTASDETAAAMISLFVQMLGRFGGDIASLFLSTGGLYLAGGVAQKQLRWIEHEGQFAKAFEASYNPILSQLLRQVPVYLIRDYAISLYGAANSALN
jgi:glucokinase